MRNMWSEQMVCPLQMRPFREGPCANGFAGDEGAHSWVRKSIGFTMDGEQTGQWLVDMKRPLSYLLTRFVSYDDA